MQENCKLVRFSDPICGNIFFGQHRSIISKWNDQPEISRAVDLGHVALNDDRADDVALDDDGFEDVDLESTRVHQKEGAALSCVK